LLSLAGKLDQLDRIMFEHSLVRHDSGIHLLASPEPFTDYRQIRPELIQKIVQLARAAYSTVVADLEDCEHLDQVRTLAASDKIIVPFRLDFISLVRTKKFLNHLTSSNVSKAHITLVANRTGQPKELTLTQVEEALGIPVRYQISDDAVAFNEAINLGVPLVIACPKSKAAVGILRLAEGLLGPVKGAPASKAVDYNWLTGNLFRFSTKSVASLFGTMTT
jgi:pilus assembly protein CpaE